MYKARIEIAYINRNREPTILLSGSVFTTRSFVGQYFERLNMLDNETVFEKLKQ